MTQQDESSERKSYKELKKKYLNNGLEILLIRASEFKKSSIGLFIDAGGIYESDELPGLSHLLCWMIGRNSSKYSQNNYFFNFLNINKGIFSKSALDDIIAMQAQVPHENLEELADILAWGIYNPIFKKETIETQITLIEKFFNENKDKMENDTIIFSLISLALEDEFREFSFSLGNKETLFIPDIKEKLQEFHSKHFTANRIKVIICSNKTWDKLDEISELFSIFPNPTTKNISIVTKPVDIKYKEQFSGSIVKYYSNLPDTLLDVVLILPYESWQSKYLILEYLIVFYYSDFPKCDVSKFIKEHDYKYNFSQRSVLIQFKLKLTPSGSLNVNEVLKMLKAFFKNMAPNQDKQTWIAQWLQKENLCQALDDYEDAKLYSNFKNFQNFGFDYTFNEEATEKVLNTIRDEKNWLVLLSTTEKNLPNTEKYFSIKYSNPTPINLSDEIKQDLDQ